MNFYTSTFKKKILISLAGITISFVLIDVILYYMVDMKSTQTSFIDDKFSKIKHYQQNNPQDKDVVFVGSSRTFFHIDTNLFKKSHIDIYNFGISGAQFEDYPTIIKELIKSPPKKVIISINVSRLYDALNISNLPTIEEASYYYDIDKSMYIDSLLKWLLNLHQFLVHSQTIFYKLQAIYTQFEPKHFDSNHTQTLDYDEEVGCQVFDIQKIAGKNLTLKCKNGDGIRIGNHPLSKEINHQNLKIFNPKAIAYLQKMLAKLHQNHIPTTLLFQPIIHNPYHYDLQQITNLFQNTDILDLTNYTLEDRLWADDAHLNNQGRKVYSKYLIDRLK